MKIYIDEAGRGPLAGPVYVGIVSDEGVASDFFGSFKDSKQCSEPLRTALYEKITNSSLRWASGSASAQEIDKHGIVWAIRTSICRWLWKVFGKGRYVLKTLKQLLHDHHVELVIDGNTDFWLRKTLGVVVTTIIKGDSKVAQISAASIIAKVERDQLMQKIALKYPGYVLEVHKGYGTLKHREAIQLLGPSKIHRKSYLKNIIVK